MVNRSMHADFDNIVQAGYNIRGRSFLTHQGLAFYLNYFVLAVFFGPETDIKTFGEEFRDINWSGLGVGFGVRGSRREDLTIQFESKFMLPSSRQMFKKANQISPQISSNSTTKRPQRHQCYLAIHQIQRFGASGDVSRWPQTVPILLARILYVIHAPSSLQRLTALKRGLTLFVSRILALPRMSHIVCGYIRKKHKEHSTSCRCIC
jgi:hypothetical protein